uniref:RBR-type E3 ubiquitin transferase n=1 Tax=Oryza brachyantha TaxID=4533 RepID=J3LQX5_ORYBR
MYPLYPQQQDLSAVMNLLNIKQHAARTLLIHHRWKMHCIYDHLDRKGRGRMLTEACIVLPENNSMSAAGSRTHPTRVTCNVCFEDLPITEASTMDCGHCFCNDCWTEHFFASINSGCKQIRCMEVNCKAICDEDMVRRLVDQKYPAASKRFSRLLLESYLEDNDSVKWCPSAPHCGRAIQVAAAGDERHSEVACPCGVAFCFSCTAPAHSPCPCPMWEKWEAKSHGDADSVKWILANTKSCPRCSKPIEKNGGCNLVQCKCGQCLCWLCGAPTGKEHTWERISGHSCNRYKEEEEEEAGDKPLSRSYAFAYYMFDGGGGEFEAHPAERASLAVARNLFEDQQQQLEHHVEHLSRMLAADVPEEVAVAKQDAVNLAKIVEAICGKMYRCIQDELLPLLVQPMSIPAYRPDGPDKAEEFVRA